MNSRPKNRKPTGDEPGKSTPYARAHRERKHAEEVAQARAARRPKFDNDPAVKLYRAEKKKAARRGAWLLQRREPVIEKPKRDQRENNAAYYERNKEILRLARLKRDANRATRLTGRDEK